MKMDTIKAELITPTEVSTDSQGITWIYPVIAILCIGIIVWKLKRYRKKHCYIRKVLKGDDKSPDFDNIINNAFHAQKLYDDLKGLCHPDKFATNPVLCEKATEIFALLVKNKHNYHELLLLKERIMKELNIKI